MKVDYDSLAREYAQHRQVQPEVLKNLIQTGELNSASQVLDVGCGTGNYTIALEKAIGCLCWGVEPSEQMLARASERTQSVRFKMGRAEQLDYPPLNSLTCCSPLMSFIMLMILPGISMKPIEC